MEGQAYRELRDRVGRVVHRDEIDIRVGIDRDLAEFAHDGDGPQDAPGHRPIAHDSTMLGRTMTMSRPLLLTIASAFRFDREYVLAWPPDRRADLRASWIDGVS